MDLDSLLEDVFEEVLILPHAYLVVHVCEQVTGASLGGPEALELALGARQTRRLLTECRQQQWVRGDALEHREQQVQQLQAPAQRVAQRILRASSGHHIEFEHQSSWLIVQRSPLQIQIQYTRIIGDYMHIITMCII